MPDEIVIVDGQGTEHHFPAGMDPKKAAQIVRNANLQAANARPLKEPTTFAAGAMKGANDYADELGRSMFDSAAHPQTAGDFLGLMLPTAMGTAGPNVLKGLKSVGGAEPIGNKVARGVARVGAEGLDLTPNVFASKTEDKVIKGLRGFAKKPEPAWLDRNMPNRSGYKPGDVGVDPGPMPQSVSSMVDPHMPNRGGIPDGGIPTGELPRPTEIDHHMANESGYVPGSASRDTTLRVGEGPTADRHMPNRSGYDELITPEKLKEDIAGRDRTTGHFEPGEGSLPDVAAGKVERYKAADVESPQEELIRRSQHPISNGPPTPYGGVEVPRAAKKPRMAMEVANPFGKDDAVYQDLLKRMGKETLPDEDALAAVEKPKLSAGEVAAAGRRMYGSRDAGRMLYGDSLSPAERAEAIKRLAPGPSQTPLTAEARINGMPQEQTLEDALKQIILSRSTLPPE